MPDASVHAARLEGRLAAFKFGYAIERKRYLSWLGGVAPSHRRRGLARDLMACQHDWARRRGYEYIETGAIKSNAATGPTKSATSQEAKKRGSDSELVGMAFMSRL